MEGSTGEGYERERAEKNGPNSLKTDKLLSTKFRSGRQRTVNQYGIDYQVALDILTASSTCQQGPIRHHAKQGS